MNLSNDSRAFINKVKSQPKHLLVVVSLLILLVAVPVSLSLVQSEQDIRQEAAKKKDTKNNKNNKNKNGKNHDNKKNNKNKKKNNGGKKKKKKNNNKNDKKKKRKDNRKKKKERRKKRRQNNNQNPGGQNPGEENPTPPPGGDTPRPPGSVETTINLELFLHGIGKGGDQVNPQGAGNNDPLSTERNVYVMIYDSNNELATETDGIVTFDTASGSYKGSVVADLVPGAYTAVVDSDYYLPKAVRGIILVQ